MASKLNWIDKLVDYVSPHAGAKRARARLAGQFYEQGLVRKYEAASQGRRTDGWITPSTNADAEIKAALLKLRDRSRDLVRNNPIAARAVQVITTNTIGTGIMAKHRAESRDQELNADLLWRSWAENASVDAAGKHDFYGLQALVMRTVAEAGECLVRRVPAKASDGLTVPLKLQVLEPDFIDSAKEQKLSGGGQIVQGVEYDGMGVVVAYWLFTQHPGGGGNPGASVRVPASEVRHIYRVDRPGQGRGVPWCAPVMIRLKDLDEFMDAQLLKLKTSCAFTAFVHDVEAPIDATQAAAALGERLEPGMIEILPPGKDIKFASPPGADGSNEFVVETLRAIAGAYGISYESLTNDYSRVNYSSGRMGWIEMTRNIEAWRWQMLIPQFCKPVWSWFAEAAGIAGSAVDGIRVEWSAPRREMIDPTREIPALVNAARAGLMSISEIHRQSGYDSDSVLEEIAADNQKLDALGLILDSDARKTMKAGVAQPYIAASDGSNEEVQTDQTSPEPQS